MQNDNLQKIGFDEDLLRMEINPIDLPFGNLGSDSSDIPAELTVGGQLQSQNFLSGVNGYFFDEDSFEINGGGTISGDLIVGGSIIGSALHIPDQDTTTNSFHVDTTGAGWIGETETNRATAPMLWTAAGALTAAGATISGAITATSGDIGGWTVIPGYLYNLVSGTPTASPSDGLVLASGNEGMTIYENTEKRVEVGYLSSGVYGLKVYDDDGSTVIFEASDTQKILTGGVIGTGSEISIQGWTHDMAFSITDADTVAWGSGTITLMNGDTFSIDAGNTGNMSAETYVYLDKGTSITVLQTTTTKATAVGSGKIMIAIAQNGTVEPTYIVFGSDNQNLNASNLVAQSILAANIGNNVITANQILGNTITATEIAASTITTNQIAATTIVAGNIAANTITANEIAANTITASEIAATTITTSELNFTPILGTNVIASINASAEGIDIQADNIAIAGTTTFTSGWAAASNAEADINVLNTTNAPAASGADVTADNETFSTESDINVLNTTNAPAAASADVTQTIIDGGVITTGYITLSTAGNIKSGQTAWNTGTGWWIGDVSGTPKFSIGVSTGDYLTWDGSTLEFTGGKYIEVSASANLKVSADTERTTASTSYTKLKEIKIGLDGVVRTSWDFHTSDYTTADAYARVYINGVAASGEYTQGSAQGNNNYRTQTYDATVAAGDLVQLYLKVFSGGPTAYCRNFRLLYDKTFYGDTTVNTD